MSSQYASVWASTFQHPFLHTNHPAIHLAFLVWKKKYNEKLMILIWFLKDLLWSHNKVKSPLTRSSEYKCIILDILAYTLSSPTFTEGFSNYQKLISGGGGVGQQAQFYSVGSYIFDTHTWWCLSQFFNFLLLGGGVKNM